MIKKFGGENKMVDKRSAAERATDEQFNINVSNERRAELRAEARKRRAPTDSEENAESIGILFDKIKTLETEVKRILEHLGMKAKFK